VITKVNAQYSTYDEGFGETTMCVDPGSSGGPVYKTHAGFGMIVGSKANNNCDSFYQSMDGALVESRTELIP
jgi:hypothetical protein